MESIQRFADKQMSKKPQDYKYVGLTYPGFLSWKIWRKAIHYLWKKFLCSRHIHLFDECLSLEHTLNCDVCELRVHIALIETSEEACTRIKESKQDETLHIYGRK